MKTAAMVVLAVAFHAAPVNAATLVCEGQLYVPCGPNPYEPPRHGACGSKPVQLSGVVVQIAENRAPPCGTAFMSSCGTVTISSGGLIAGQYVRWKGVSVDDEEIYIHRDIDVFYRARGTINRISGSIVINEIGDRGDSFNWKFRGTCERRERLF